MAIDNVSTLPAELTADRVVAVLRAPTLASPAAVVSAIVQAGIRCVELTYTIEGVLRHIETAAAIKSAVIGAGTVLTARQARDAISAGAQFLVTPAVRPEVAEAAAAANIPVLMGAWSPTEVAFALDLKPAAVKLFPGEIGGPAHLKALCGPFSNARFIPSGGVTAANAADWLAAGAVAVSAGSSLAPPMALQAGNADEIGRAALDFVNALPRRLSG